jgi:hypothetical protein
MLSGAKVARRGRRPDVRRRGGDRRAQPHAHQHLAARRRPARLATVVLPPRGSGRPSTLSLECAVDGAVRETGTSVTPRPRVLDRRSRQCLCSRSGRGDRRCRLGPVPTPGGPCRTAPGAEAPTRPRSGARPRGLGFIAVGAVAWTVAVHRVRRSRVPPFVHHCARSRTCVRYFAGVSRARDSTPFPQRARSLMARQ